MSIGSNYLDDLIKDISDFLFDLIPDIENFSLNFWNLKYSYIFRKYTSERIICQIKKIPNRKSKYIFKGYDISYDILESH